MELGEEERTWREVAASEERILLMRKMLKEDLAFADLEEFGIEFTNKLKSKKLKNKPLYTKVTQQAMRVKLADEQALRRELIRVKEMRKKDLSEEIGGVKTRKFKRAMLYLNEKAREEKLKLKEKYNKKLRHIKDKYREQNEEQENEVPEDLEYYETLKVFNKNKYNEMEKETYKVKIIGDIELDEKELQVLKLHPKFAILPKLLEGGLDIEEEMANSKLRMQISKEIEEKKRKAEDMLADVDEVGKAEVEEEMEVEAKERQVFDAVERRYDERKRRVTDLRESNRITLPKPLPATEEAKIEIRREIHRDIYDKYRNNNCSKNGDQESNLSKEQQEGLKSLEKKVKERKIIVMKTDKSSRFAVCSEEAYLRMGQAHTSKDRRIERKDLIEIEKNLNAHCVAWSKLWRSGENHDHKGRIVHSKKTLSENTADMYLLLKDHKEGEKTRPIVTGCTSNTLGMSNNTASILEAVAASERSSFEAVSSEDMLSKAKAFNEMIEERRSQQVRPKILMDQDKVEKRELEMKEEEKSSQELGLLGDQRSQIIPGDLVSQEPKSLELPFTIRSGEGEIDDEKTDDKDQPPYNCTEKKEKEVEEDFCLIGCDVIALFPSLTSKRTGEIIRDRILKSPLKFEGFDSKQGRRYIVLNQHLTGNLGSFRRTLPWRRKCGGTKPTMTGAMGSKIDDDPEGQWVFPERELTEEEEREVIARCTEIAVRIVFENFCYKFGGEVLKQEEGGPIGARMTMAAARLVMLAWAEGYRKVLEGAGVEIGVLTGYVDDVRQVSTFLKLGSRYLPETKTFRYSEEAAEEDEKLRLEGESNNGRMARVCLPAMNDILEDLQFTVEVPEDFQNERLPTLDFSLWMEEGKLTHTYFQKSMKTPFVIMEKTAMGKQQKMTILSNEATRRLTNIDHEKLGVEEQKLVLEQFTQELKNSGYYREQAKEIIVSGFRGWRRRLEKRGESGLYRPAHTTLAERERKKLLERETWYLPRTEEKERIEGELMRKKLIGRRRIKGMKKNKKEAVDQKEDPIKAVMFVPCTKDSRLTKELREAENAIGEKTGSKLKMVERCGVKIADILTCSDPWKGKDCLRDGCLLCRTKSKTGKLQSQDCKRRSVVYETWCRTCQLREEKKIEEKFEEDEKKKNYELKKIKIFKYIGETGKSCYERGVQHLSDASSLKTGSHILKHYFDQHEGERLEDLEFGMKIRCTAKSAFERQVSESVIIQQESGMHHILNSRSEYNRCALPRLTTKLGEEEFSAWKKDLIEEKRKEEDLEEKIRHLRKTRNKERIFPQNSKHLPPQKKRKLSRKSFKVVRQIFQDWKKEEREEKEVEPAEEYKKMKSSENGERRPELEKEDLKTEMGREIEELEESLPAKVILDWDKEFRQHEEELEDLTRRKDEAEGEIKEDGYKQSWDLLDNCVQFLRENELSWKKGKEEREKEKLRYERLQKARMKSTECKKKIVQKRIDELFIKLPMREREKLEREEMREKKKELELIKEELWKYRGKEDKEIRKEKTTKKGENRKLREKLEHIIGINKRLKIEKIAELERRENYNKQQEELKRKRKEHELLILKRQEDRRIQIENKKKKAERWEMAKWVHQFIKENTNKWEKEKIERLEERRKTLETWEKKSRLEKIATLKEKWRQKCSGPKVENNSNEGKVKIDDEEFCKLVEDEEDKWLNWRDNTRVNGKKDKRKRDGTEDDVEELGRKRDKDIELELKIRLKRPRFTRIMNNNMLFEGSEDDDYLVEVLTTAETLELEKKDLVEEDEETENGEEVPDLGQDQEKGLCLDCLYYPCLCLLLKTELKMKILSTHRDSEGKDNLIRLEGGGGEDITSDISPLLLARTQKNEACQEAGQEGNIVFISDNPPLLFPRKQIDRVCQEACQEASQEDHRGQEGNILKKEGMGGGNIAIDVPSPLLIPDNKGDIAVDIPPPR